MTQRNTPLTQQEFISRAQKVWGDKFDLSRAKYKNLKTKVEVVCPTHGVFYIQPTSFLRGAGCRKCGLIQGANKHRGTTESFIKRARALYGDAYDYSKVHYVAMREKVTIVCPKHGEFSVSASNFLNGYACKRCGYERNAMASRKSVEQFIKEAKQVHGDRYDYSLVEYKNTGTPVAIKCKKHGVFMQIPDVHLNGHNCPKCALEDLKNPRMSNDTFVQKAKAIHGEEYDYSECKYAGAKKPVRVICKKHGGFDIVAHQHLRGFGCPYCKSPRGEIAIRTYLERNNIKFERQKVFAGCKYKKLLRFDFFLPDHNLCVEFQGNQHYKPIGIWGGEAALARQITKDNIKRKYCAENDIGLLEIKYDEDINSKLQFAINNSFTLNS